MGAGEILIERQRVFAFGDARCRPLCENVDASQALMCTRVVGDRGQGFGQLCFGRRKGRLGISHKEIRAFNRVHARQCNERLNIVGVG